ncbi:Integron integrase IntIPac [uncultured Candidatus Thioglobus sp.]|nr:Integron integrase IntIPac [uncultured Candidatus Thioglobus sp.]
MSIVPKNKTLLEEMRALLRRQGYAYGTENTYCDWVRRFVKFSNVQSRIEMLENAEQKVERFLTHLAIKQKVAPSTQNQALNALVFLYTKVLKQPLEGVNAARSRKEPRIPVVMSKKEVAKILALIDGTVGLIVRLLYAGGLRISEAVRLRVQDVDFEFKQIIVRDGKGKKDREL